MSTQGLLSPLQLVEVGNRITEQQAAELGIRPAIDEARIVARTLLDSTARVLEMLEIGPREVDRAFLGSPWQQVSRWAEKNPRRVPHSYERVPLPAPGTVLTGRKQRAGSVRRYGLVIRPGAVLLLGDTSPGTAYGSLSGLAEAAGYSGRAKTFWSTVGRFNPPS